jgi:hypothetical protein
VLQALEDVVNGGNLRPFPEFQLPCLGLDMQVIHPRMVGSRMMVLHMVLELDNVAVRNVFGVDRLNERSFRYRPDVEDG